MIISLMAAISFSIMLEKNFFIEKNLKIMDLESKTYFREPRPQESENERTNRATLLKH